MVDEERIWAPWRIGYISAGDKTTETQILPTAWQPGAEHGCFLCRAAGEYTDSKSAARQNLVIRRDNHAITLLNRFPYNNGHLLVAPLRHVGELHELTSAEHLAAMKSLSEFTQNLAARINAEGFNIGLNLGRVAGAGVPGHLHWHLVPRWPGDNNFMPTTAGTRVIPQSLEALWETLAGDHAAE